MTAADHAAAVLRRLDDLKGAQLTLIERAAIERAIEALGEVERLRAENDKDTDRIAVLVAERDAALAEVERLRAENRDLFNSFPICSQSLQGGDCSAENRWKEVVANVVAERDAALAEIERLRAESVEADLRQKGDRDMEGILRGEIERLRAELAETRHESAERLTMSARAHTARKKERDAWRACADQLAAAINNGFGADITTPAGQALAEYDRLKAGEQ